MTQKQIEMQKIFNQFNNYVKDEFTFYINPNKYIQIYFSKIYKEHVLSINFGKNKKFVFTKSMWKIFRNYIDKIDESILDFE